MTQPEVSLGEIERIVAGHHHDPHSVLGAHPGPDGVIIRALRPLAKSVTAVLDDGRRLPMTHVHQGVFAVTVPDEKVPGYRIAATYADASGAEGVEEVRDDPYRYLPTLGEFDLYLIGEGRHEELWRVLGGHVREVGQATGTAFAVWAPNAHGVRVTGDFNYWDGIAYPMRSLGGSGVWELFVPGVIDGARYKYAICGAGRGVAGEGRPVGQRRRAAARHRVGGVYLAVHLERPGLGDGAGRAPAGARADEHLRGAPRLVAAGPVLP